MKGAKAPGKTLRHVFVLILIMVLILVNSTNVLAGTQGGSQAGNVINANPGNLTQMLKNYEGNSVIKLEAGSYTLNGTTELMKPVSIIGAGESKTIVTVKGNGESYGFRIGKGEQGNYSLSDLTIKCENSQSAISVQAYTEKNFAEVNISNCDITNDRKTAIDFEGTNYPGPDTNYFDMTVKNCKITAANYGIGSGLNNNNPNVSNSSLAVENCQFNGIGGSASIYCIHAPNSFENLKIEGNVFKGARSGGIKYVFCKENENSVVIKNNDFSGVNLDVTNSSYSLMCTNLITDLTDKYSYCWATELSGNNLINQNVLILAKAKLETVWFPDGQAKNRIQYNNLSNTNETNEGTRYGTSKYGEAIALTDFNILQDEISFDKLTDKVEIIEYAFNGETSGAYTNFADLNQYWTENNQRHCGSSLANFLEADKITRWSVADENVAVIVMDDKGQVKKTEKGKIQINPVGYGITYLTGVVGGGDEGTLPNSKEDKVRITVKAPVFYHSNLPEGKKQSVYPDGTYDVGAEYEVLGVDATGFAVKGYDFVGWATSETGNVEYKPGVLYLIPADETNLYAVWEKAKEQVNKPNNTTTVSSPETGDEQVVDMCIFISVIAMAILVFWIKMYRKDKK